MIGKVPRSGSGFRGLINYLVQGAKAEPDPDRVAWSATRNLLVDDLELAPRLMRAVAKQSARCKRPVYHLVISWHQNENPSEAMMRTVAEATLSDLDLAEHQAIVIAHRDTDHRHLHIVANRVHPGTGKTWHASMDYARIERSLRRQAEAMHMSYVPGRFNDPDRFKGTPRRVRDPEMQASLRTGTPPLERWSREEVRERRPRLATIVEAATDWDSLRRGLAAEGLVLSAKGQGLVIVGPDGTMKLSDLGKGIRLAALESRFGERLASALHRETKAASTSSEEGAATQAPRPASAPDDRAAQPRVSATNDQREARPERRYQRYLPPGRVDPDPRAIASQRLHQAFAAYALAKQLAVQGLAGTGEVRDALTELRRAKAERQRHMTLREFLVHEVGEERRSDASFDAARQQRRDVARDPAWRRSRRGRLSRARRDDRER